MLPGLILSEIPSPAHMKALVRVDFNVPFRDGEILDTTRLERALPTIRFLVKAKARVILATHIGRPRGIKSPETSTVNLVPYLEKLLGQRVLFAPDCVGDVVNNAVEAMKDGDVLMLENLRWHGGEEADDDEFARQLASLADFYVNDGFSVSHRAHASVHAVTRHLPSYAGFLFGEEVAALQNALEKPERPLLAIVGGAKVSTKLEILVNMVDRVDGLILGGGIANTFLKASGYGIGKSLHEPDMLDTAREIMTKAGQRGCEILLPFDVVVAEDLGKGEDCDVVTPEHIGDQQCVFDIGPRTIQAICEKIESARTLVWNGPFGVFEVPPFDGGTKTTIKKAMEQTKKGLLYSIAGGGETVAAITMCGDANGFSYLSTAGGAFLEWLEGRSLPGFTALRDSASKRK